MWDVEKAIKHLESHAHKDEQGHDKSLGKCARYVREAIEAGGVHLVLHNSAKDYGSSLEKVGMKALPGQPTQEFQAGDVAIIQPIKGHPHGHMTMYNGAIWISDFKQYHGLYPGASYRKLKPHYKIYRIARTLQAPPHVKLAMPHVKGAPVAQPF